MAFQLKNFVSITASMLNHIRATTTKITDLVPGSAARTLVEAPAVEIEELYLQIFNGIRDAIPVATFRSFSFDKLAAAFARGYVSVSTETAPGEDFTVPSGTEFTATDGRAYSSTEAVVWKAGINSIRIPVIAAAAGASYNIATGGITASTAFDSSYTISNSPIENGRNTETDAEQEARFATFIGSLSRGTEYACRNAAVSATILDSNGNISEYVTRSGMSSIPGYVKIYIYSSAGIPSRDLLYAAQLIIDGSVDTDSGKITPGYRAAGVKIDVLAMSERALDLTVKVDMFSGYELTDAVKQGIADAYGALLSSVESGSILYIEDIETAVLGVAGVKDAVISATANVECGVYEVLVPGTVAVTAL